MGSITYGAYYAIRITCRSELLFKGFAGFCPVLKLGELFGRLKRILPKLNIQNAGLAVLISLLILKRLIACMVLRLKLIWV